MNTTDEIISMCAKCGDRKELPLRRDDMDGYVCLTCIDRELTIRDVNLKMAMGHLNELLDEIITTRRDRITRELHCVFCDCNISIPVESHKPGCPIGKAYNFYERYTASANPMDVANPPNPS